MSKKIHHQTPVEAHSVLFCALNHILFASFLCWRGCLPPVSTDQFRSETCQNDDEESIHLEDDSLLLCELMKPSKVGRFDPLLLSAEGLSTFCLIWTGNMSFREDGHALESNRQEHHSRGRTQGLQSTFIIATKKQEPFLSGPQMSSSIMTTWPTATLTLHCGARRSLVISGPVF